MYVLLNFFYKINGGGLWKWDPSSETKRNNIIDLCFSCKILFLQKSAEQTETKLFEIKRIYSKDTRSAGNSCIFALLCVATNIQWFQSIILEQTDTWRLVCLRLLIMVILLFSLYCATLNALFSTIFEKEKEYIIMYSLKTELIESLSLLF